MTSQPINTTSDAAEPRAPEPRAPEPRAPEPTTVIRFRVDGRDWSEHLPPVPAGHSVSVSFTNSQSRERHGEMLANLGYHVVRFDYGEHSGEFVDLVANERIATNHPAWWRTVNALAEQVYALAFGPCAVKWREVVSAHIAAVNSDSSHAA